MGVTASAGPSTTIFMISSNKCSRAEMNRDERSG